MRAEFMLWLEALNVISKDELREALTKLNEKLTYTSKEFVTFYNFVFFFIFTQEGSACHHTL